MSLTSHISSTARRALVVRSIPAPTSLTSSSITSASSVATSADAGVVIRFLVIAIILTSAVGVYLWSRMEVPSLAVELDAARSDLARAEVTRDRLELELATLRQPGRLQAEADRLGLVAPVAVVTVAPASPDTLASRSR